MIFLRFNFKEKMSRGVCFVDSEALVHLGDLILDFSRAFGRQGQIIDFSRVLGSARA